MRRPDVVELGLLTALALIMAPFIWYAIALELPDHCDLYSDWNFRGDRLTVERCYSIGIQTSERIVSVRKGGF
jgi:hypothetical protein